MAHLWPLIRFSDAIDRFRSETVRVYNVLEIHLSGKYTGEPREYLAGNGKGKYSVADMATWPWVTSWNFSVSSARITHRCCGRLIERHGR